MGVTSSSLLELSILGLDRYAPHTKNKNSDRKGAKQMTTTGEIIPMQFYCINTTCDNNGYRWAFSQNGYTLVCGNDDCLDFIKNHSTKRDKPDLDKLATELIDPGHKIKDYKSMLYVDLSK